MSHLPGVWSSRRRGILTWASRTSGATNYRLAGIAYNGSMFGINGLRITDSSKFIYSADGETWNAGATGTFDHFNGDIIYWNSMWIACGQVAGASRVYTCTDSALSSWTQRYSGLYPVPFSIAADSTKATNVGPNNGWVNPSSCNSPDGISWTLQPDVATVSGYTESVCANSDKMVMCTSDTTHLFAYSSDHGDTWTEVSTTASDYLRAIACNSTGSKYVAVGENGTCWTSVNGTGWIEQTDVCVNDCLCIAYDGAGKWIVGTRIGTIYESTNDGVSWVASSDSQCGTSAIISVIYAQNKWVIGTDDGKISTSE